METLGFEKVGQGDIGYIETLEEFSLTTWATTTVHKALLVLVESYSIIKSLLKKKLPTSCYYFVTATLLELLGVAIGAIELPYWATKDPIGFQ